MYPAADVLLSESAAASLDALAADRSAASQTIARRVKGLRSLLLADFLHGEVVRKSAIPRALREKYGLENLYVEDLPSFWRLLYTVVRRGGRREVVVIEIVDHRMYDRWFPGKGS